MAESGGQIAGHRHPAALDESLVVPNQPVGQADPRPGQSGEEGLDRVEGVVEAAEPQAGVVEAGLHEQARQPDVGDGQALVHRPVGDGFVDAPQPSYRRVHRRIVGVGAGTVGHHRHPGFGVAVRDQAAEQRGGGRPGAGPGHHHLGRVVESVRQLVEGLGGVEEPGVVHRQVPAVGRCGRAQVQVAGAVGDYDERVSGHRIGRVVQVEDSAGARGLSAGVGGGGVDQAVERACLDAEAGPAGHQVEHHPAGVGLADPEAVRAAVGADAAVAGGHPLP